MNNEALQATTLRIARFAMQFLRWWGAELLALFPRRLRRRLTAFTPSLRFELLGSRLLLRMRHRGRRRTLGSWDLTEVDTALTGAVERAVRGAGLKRTPVLLRPAPEQVFRCMLSLPEQAQENLREVLAFEIDRRTPFRPDRVFATHRIVRRQPDQERIEVELIVVPRRTLAPVLTIVAGCGLSSPKMEIPGPSRHARSVIPVFSPEEGTGHRRPWLAASAVTLTATLLVAALVIRLDRLDDERYRLDEAIRVATAEAVKADQLREEIAVLSQETAAFLDRKRTAPPLLAVLNEIARLLPDHTWIQEVQVRGKEIQIRGQSASAAGLVELIEYSPTFRKANFTSPITRHPNEERERFHLAFELEQLDVPKLADNSRSAP
jgi:general secretion pathway protein L